MLSMSIKHRKGGRIDAFDWFIGDSLILARCKEIPASFNGENFIGKAGKKGFIEEDGYRKGIRNLILRFLLQNFVSSLVMRP